MGCGYLAASKTMKESLNRSETSRNRKRRKFYIEVVSLKKNQNPKRKKIDQNEKIFFKKISKKKSQRKIEKISFFENPFFLSKMRF